VYLYGGAGTGKSFIALQLAQYLGFELVELNCSQFTSPLEIIGGQTIEGYQKGKLEMAWTNTGPTTGPGTEKYPGCIFLMDELPKLDPNTAGLLNSALAKVKDFQFGTPTIRNGKGEKLDMANVFMIANGNTKLNEVNTEYEANFKQDLSLQDRFSGSTYRVIVNYEMEVDEVMKDYLFIFLYMVKVRRIIERERWSGYAFVSVRIMQNLRDTYKVYRETMDKVNTGDKSVPSPLVAPKTLKEGIY